MLSLKIKQICFWRSELSFCSGSHVWVSGPDACCVAVLAFRPPFQTAVLRLGVETWCFCRVGQANLRVPAEVPSGVGWWLLCPLLPSQSKRVSHSPCPEAPSIPQSDPVMACLADKGRLQTYLYILSFLSFKYHVLGLIYLLLHVPSSTSYTLYAFLWACSAKRGGSTNSWVPGWKLPLPREVQTACSLLTFQRRGRTSQLACRRLLFRPTHGFWLCCFTAAFFFIS